MRSSLLRRALAALAILAPGAAAAADYSYPDEVLRGTYAGPPALDEVVSWEGPYAGAFAGYSQANFGFGNAVRNMIAHELRVTRLESENHPSNWLALKDTSHRDVSFGGFAGYNYQVDGIVFGFEADYTHTRLRGRTYDEIGRISPTSDGTVYHVQLTGLAQAEINDYGTLRARLGYTSGAFLPFVTAGLAVGQATLHREASVSAPWYVASNPRQNSGWASFNTQILDGVPLPSSVSVKSKEAIIAGFAGGVGVDVAVTQNVFLRGEYQYVFFDSFDGTKLHINTVRAAAGVKF